MKPGVDEMFVADSRDFGPIRIAFARRHFDSAAQSYPPPRCRSQASIPRSWPDHWRPGFDARPQEVLTDFIHISMPQRATEKQPEMIMSNGRRTQGASKSFAQKIIVYNEAPQAGALCKARVTRGHPRTYPQIMLRVMMRKSVKLNSSSMRRRDFIRALSVAR